MSELISSERMRMAAGLSITTGQFLALLHEKVLSGYGYAQNELFISGKREGWLTDMDEMSEHDPLSRGAAARILHEILRRVIREAEEEDWSAATELVDLYDCHRCVQHIAQVYVKGIMTAAGFAEEEEIGSGVEGSRKKLRFGGEDALSPDDAALAIGRLLQPDMRILPKTKESVSAEEGQVPTEEKESPGSTARRISRAEAERLFQVQEKVLAVDVGLDTGDLAVSRKIQLPMMKLLENPYLLQSYRDYVLLLYCDGGYQSEIAANCLLEHGYPKVFYFGLEEGNDMDQAKSNIVLIGMPGAGKSTLGVVLAKEFGCRFLDTDIMIQEKEGRLLREIIENDGIDRFLEIEEAVATSVTGTNCVIATGGSVVYGEQAMRHLKEIGTVVYLELGYEDLSLRLGNLKGRGVVLRGDQTLRDLYFERKPLYETYADITIDETGADMEQTLDMVKDALKCL